MTDHLQRAIDPAVANVADGGGPFSAVGVAPPGQVFEGVNRVTGVPAEAALPCGDERPWVARCTHPQAHGNGCAPFEEWEGHEVRIPYCPSRSRSAPRISSGGGSRRIRLLRTCPSWFPV
jgi:hypothetical protein